MEKKKNKTKKKLHCEVFIITTFHTRTYPSAPPPPQKKKKKKNLGNSWPLWSPSLLRILVWNIFHAISAKNSNTIWDTYTRKKKQKDEHTHTKKKQWPNKLFFILFMFDDWTAKRVQRFSRKQIQVEL